MNLNLNRSICFWSWNSDITKNGVSEQLKAFADGRIDGVVIHARAGLRIDYLSDEWMSLVSFAVTEATKYDLEVWIYDEQGWPSGFAAGVIPALGEAYCHKNLCYATKGEFSLKKVNLNSILAIYLPTSDGYSETDCSDFEKIPSDSLVFWQEIDYHYVDLLNPDVTKEFICAVHEKYYQKLENYFGNTIKGFFTDEPQLNNSGYPWSASLEKAYLKKTGRKLFSDLWLLAIDGAGFERVRTDFWNVVSDLYYHSFTKEISDWCYAHNVALTGHFAMEDGLCRQISSNGGVMRNYRAMQLPGIDHLGSRVASPILMKQASSVSRQFGNGCVLSETFGCAGWGVSFKRLEWIWGGQSVLGITKPCYHLAAYSIEGSRKRDYPAFFSKQELWWDDYRYFAARIRNINDMMTEGERDLNTLVISPLQSICALYTDESQKQDKIKNISAQFRVLAENLLDLQLDFDLADPEQFIEEAKFNDGSVTLGNIAYKQVFLSYSPYISEELERKLKEFSQAGIKIIVMGEMPVVLTQAGEKSPSGFRADVLVNRRDTIEKYIEFQQISRSAVLLDAQNGKPVSGVVIHTRKTKSGKNIHIWPRENFPGGEFLLRVYGINAAYSVDPFDKSESLLPSLSTKNGFAAFVKIKKQENIFIRGDINPPAERYSDKITECQYNFKDFEVSLCEPNCLTVDRVCVSFDSGKTFGEEMPVIFAVDYIYEHSNGAKKTVVLKYSFFCEVIPEGRVTLAFEDREYLYAAVNGVDLPKKSNGRWIDDSIGEYDITSYIRLGENSFELTYDICGKKYGEDLTEIFETEKNRFFYPIEPDNVYLRGNFDVKPKGNITDNGFCLQSSQFVVTKPSKKSLGDLTVNGAWFYRGNAKYKLRGIVPTPGKRTIIKIGGYDGALVKVIVNGKEQKSLSQTPEFDVTDYIKETDNDVFIELVGTNRNLLGPHHHICGEVSLVGPAVFEGRHEELTDFMIPGAFDKQLWTDEYGFIPFGVKQIIVKLK